MKKSTSLLLFFLLSTSLLAQEPLKREFLTNDSLQFRALAEFENIAQAEHYFVNGMGIYEITRYTDADGNKTWLISVNIEDSYKDNLPETYAYFRSNIVLIYEGDSQGIRKPSFGDRRKREFLEQIIQDRVYARPPFQDKIMTLDGLDGRPSMKGSNGNFIRRSVNQYQITGGGPARLIRFDTKKKTFQILKMA